MLNDKVGANKTQKLSSRNNKLNACASRSIAQLFHPTPTPLIIL